ncbi:MAG: hypothetical protein WKG32_16105 [Gemmatimonadaceae bacterium]
MRVTQLPAVVAALASVGCYSYRPVTIPAPAMGTRVSVELTDLGTATLGRLLGNEVVEVRGELTGATERSVSLAVQAVRLRNGVENYWNREPVTLERSTIALLSERRVSRKRSFLAGGAVAAVATIAAAVASGRGSGSSPGGGGGPGPR